MTNLVLTDEVFFVHHLGNPLAKAFPAAWVGLYITIFLPHPKSLSKRERLPAAKKDFHFYPYCSCARKKVSIIIEHFTILLSLRRNLDR